MRATRKTTSTESRGGRKTALQILAEPGHPVWAMLGTAVRLAVMGVFVFAASYLTSTDYGLAITDEGGRDLLTWLAVGGWSEYQRRRPI